MVFPKLFVPLFESTSRLDPLYPCAWQTKFLSASFQLVTHRSFHLPLLKISIDPLDGKPFIMRKRTEKSKKKKKIGENFGWSLYVPWLFGYKAHGFFNKNMSLGGKLVLKLGCVLYPSIFAQQNLKITI